MSEWYAIKTEDISLNLEEGEVNFYVKSNDFGAVYATLTFKQIINLKQKLDDIIRQNETKPKKKSKRSIVEKMCVEHGQFPCRKCGTKHFKGCQCGFCR